MNRTPPQRNHLALPTVEDYFGKVSVEPCTWFRLVDKGLVRLFGWNKFGIYASAVLIKLTAPNEAVSEAPSD